MGRREGWDPHDASAGLRRMGLGFVVLPAITMLEGGSCPILLKKAYDDKIATDYCVSSPSIATNNQIVSPYCFGFCPQGAGGRLFQRYRPKLDLSPARRVTRFGVANFAPICDAG
jgi:hypothetical protein